MTEEICRQVRMLFPLSFIGQFHRPVGREGVKGMEEEIVILAHYEFLLSLGV